MSSTSPSFALIQPLLDEGKRPLLVRFRAMWWLLWQLAKEVPRSFTIWLGIAILQGIMPPFQLWASGKLVSNIQMEIAGADAQPWLWAMAMAAALAGVRVLAPLMNWAEVVIHERGMASIEGRILARTTEVDLEVLEYQQFYDVTKRIAEECRKSLQESLKAFKELVTNGIPLVGSVILIASIDWRLMLVLMLPLIPIIAEAMRQGGFMWNALRQQTHDRRIAQYIADRFSDHQSAKEIRLFGLADELISRWQYHFMHTRREMRGKTTRASLKLQLTSTWADLIIYGGLIWLITGGLVEPTAADITVLMGAFMTSGNHSFGLQRAMLEFGNQGGFAVDVHKFLALPATWQSSPRAGTVPDGNAITLNDVKFAYPGTDANVIDGMNLTIRAEETVAIVGENGAGKTTLLKLLLGLYQPDSGSVWLGNRNLQEVGVAERQARMAAVFQSFNRYPESITDNITLPMEYNQTELDRVITEAGLEEVVHRATDGLDTILSPDLGGIDLSGGQWQRLAIARAGYKRADILALDEPTSALDPMAEVDIFRRFSALSKNRTTILISHRLGMARLADRIIVIEHGKITEDGSHRELVRNGGHYAELWEMQSRWYQ